MHGAQRLTPELLLRAYAQGVFPMAERRNDDLLYWISPEARGILPFDNFHVPRRLARTIRSDHFEVRVDTAFADVIRGCAAPAPGREESWINREIVEVYTELHRNGHAHSVESWREGQLVGGLYGVRLGGAFFGESMFSRERDASKVALAHLVARLIKGGFALLDAQFLTAHLERFGAIEIPRAEYLDLLTKAIARKAYWPEPSGNSGSCSLEFVSGDKTLTGAVDAMAGATWPGSLVMQLITHTS
jgi:leucyl/phenylalanyl-tRNA---protein transferase